MEKRFELSSSMSFLIIDENESYRIAISTILRKLGFREIQMAYSSMQALKIVKTSIVDLIICERSMPVIDGALILKEVRESFEIRGTPFLMMGPATKVTKEDIVLLAEYEIDGYLTKPFTPKTIMEKITQSLEHYKNPLNIEFIISQAKQLMLNQKADQALQMFLKLLETMPDSARLRVCISRCYRELNLPEPAMEYCREAIQKNPLYAQAYDEIGKIYLGQNKIEDAVTAFKNGISISPKYPPRYEIIIDTLIKKELYSDAEFVLRKAVENAVAIEDIDYKYAEVLFFLRKLEKALLYFERAVAHNPDNRALLNLMGICLKDLGRADDALKHYNAALKRYPEDTRIMFNKALCLIALVRYDQAAKILKVVHTLEPNNKKVFDKLEEVLKKIQD